MNLIYGTYNPSKLESMIKMLDGLNISIASLETLDMDLKKAEETGKDPLANATQKAIFYFKQIKKPIFSCDSGLYFEGVDESDQPGVLIKRIHGNNLTYREMLNYYSNLAGRYGGRLTAYYKNAICLVIDENNIYKYDGEDICSEKFYIVDKPHVKYREGFPLDSISVEIESMKYYYDLEGSKSESLGFIDGFRNFFIRSLKNYLNINSSDKSICLETERLRLRDHKMEDLDTHHRLFSDKESMHYLEDIMTNSIEESRENLLAAIDDINNPKRTKYFLRMEDRNTKEHIGEIGYTVTDFTPVGKLVHLGYFTYPKYWNKGYTTEALKEIMRFAFEDNEVFRITTGCIKENIGSERVMEKCGMLKEAEYKMMEWHDGRMKDRVSYRILKDEWRTNL